MKPSRHHSWTGGTQPLPPRRELTADELEDETKPRSRRGYVRPCGCSKAGPCVVGRCALATPDEAPQLATTCVACGYRIAFGRCGRCGTRPAEAA